MRIPWAFFVLVFALSLPFWLLGPLAEHFLRLPFHLPVSALQFVCPLIAAFILVYREEKLGGISRLLKRVFDFKSIRHKIWYVPIIFLMPLIIVLSYGVKRLLGLPLPEPYIPLLTIPFAFVEFFLAAVCEETGWTGYATDPLQAQWSALTTGLILGSVWAIWHAIAELSANPPAWVAGQFFTTILLRIFIVWLSNNTGKSVLAAILLHVMANASELIPNNGSLYDPAIAAPIMTVIAVIVTFFWGSKTLTCYRYAHPQASYK